MYTCVLVLSCVSVAMNDRVLSLRHPLQVPCIVYCWDCLQNMRAAGSDSFCLKGNRTGKASRALLMVME